MSTAPNPSSSPLTTHSQSRNVTVSRRVADVLADLGGIPAKRLYCGNAEPVGIDALKKAHGRGDLCELVDGFLVERAMGYRESLIAMMIGRFLIEFVSARKLGVVSGPDGFFQLSPTLVRGPDVAFTSWNRFPDRKVPTEAYPTIVPNLVVEVVSEGNTRTEMTNKRREYFGRGVQLIWMVDPDERSVAVWRSMVDYRVLGETESLDGENVIPGLSIPLHEVFGVLNGPDESNGPDAATDRP